ncbi:MAG: MMPL family transporter [Chloroflexi bacterium]|nr:MMPL family transporter [Chloroflexota bacterium]
MPAFAPAPSELPARAPATVRVAMWSVRHRWLVAVLWFVGTLGTFGVSLQAGGIRSLDASGDPNEQATEAQTAYDVFNAAGGSGTTIDEPSERLVLVLAGSPGAATDPAFQAIVTKLLADLGAATVEIDGSRTPTFRELVDPFSAPPAAGLVSSDGSAVRIVGRVPGERPAVKRLLVPVRPIVDAVRAANPDLAIHIVSSTFINDDIDGLISGDLDSSLRLTIPLTFLILLLAFGAIVASVIPLVLAITSLLGAFGILGLYSQLIGAVSPNASQLIVLIGLAVAVDYSLFMVTRFRTERRGGRSVPEAIQVSSSTAGRAVFFSGVAVVISLAGLFTLGIALFSSMAVGTIGVVLVSVVGSLTFLPATLAIAGDRVNLGRPATWLPRLARRVPIGPVRGWGASALAWLESRAARPEGSGFWGRLVTAVMARPVALTLLATAVLLAAASPVTRLHTGVTDITGFPSSIDGVAGIRLINEKWPQGTDLTLDVVVTDAADPATQAAIETFRTRALALPGLGEPVTVAPTRDGSVVMLSFTMSGGQNDRANREIVRTIRATTAPSAFGNLEGVRVYVSGDAANSLDVTDIYANGTPRIFAFVLGLSFLLMLVAFRSIVIPIKAILLNLLSTAAAFGLLVLVFQDGWLAEPLGITAGSVIESWVPVFIFTILFGLSMDYHLFILTRIKEARDRGLDSRAAVAQGISVTSGTITSAASIMVVVFAVFVTLKFVFIQQLGLGLAVAVFIDATLIRSVLLPASMTLLGEWNWWLPGFLRWLPQVTIEGHVEEPATAAASG